MEYFLPARHPGLVWVAVAIAALGSLLLVLLLGQHNDFPFAVSHTLRSAVSAAQPLWLGGSNFTQWHRWRGVDSPRLCEEGARGSVDSPGAGSGPEYSGSRSHVHAAVGVCFVNQDASLAYPAEPAVGSNVSGPSAGAPPGPPPAGPHYVPLLAAILVVGPIRRLPDPLLYENIRGTLIGGLQADAVVFWVLSEPNCAAEHIPCVYGRGDLAGAEASLRPAATLWLTQKEQRNVSCPGLDATMHEHIVYGARKRAAAYALALAYEAAHSVTFDWFAVTGTDRMYLRPWPALCTLGRGALYSSENHPDVSYLVPREGAAHAFSILAEYDRCTPPFSYRDPGIPESFFREYIGRAMPVHGHAYFDIMAKARPVLLAAARIYAHHPPSSCSLVHVVAGLRAAWVSFWEGRQMRVYA